MIVEQDLSWLFKYCERWAYQTYLICWCGARQDNLIIGPAFFKHSF